MSTYCHCGRGPNCTCGAGSAVKREDSLPSYETLFPSGYPPPGAVPTGDPPFYPGVPTSGSSVPIGASFPNPPPFPGLPPTNGPSSTTGTSYPGPPPNGISYQGPTVPESTPTEMFSPYPRQYPGHIGFTSEPVPSGGVSRTYTMPSYNTAGRNIVVHPNTSINTSTDRRTAINGKAKSCISVCVILAIVLVVVRLLKATFR